MTKERTLIPPDVTSYRDYRLFLKDRFTFLKSSGSKISYQYCGLHLGTSKNYIKLIMDQKRHLGLDKVSGIGTIFKLSKYERQYLFFLVVRATVDDEDLIQYLDGVLGGLKVRKSLRHIDTIQESSAESEVLYGDWLKLLIHSIVKLKDFVDDPEWIQQTLVESYSATAIREAQDDLIKRKLLRSNDGKISQSEFVFRRPAAADVSAYQIFKLGLEKSIEVIEQVERFRPNQSYMTTAALSEVEYKEVRRKFLELRDFIIDTSKNSTESTQIFFTCNHIFAVTK